MARLTVPQQNFSAGELSKSLAGRFDLGVYYNGGLWYQNFIATVQGKAQYRSGSKHVWNTRGNGVCRLIPFEYNTEQAYILAFTDLKMRIIKDGGIVTGTPLVVTGITNANPAVVTYTGTDPTNGQAVILDDIVGMIELNNQEYTIANVDTGANTFELQGVNSTGFTPYASGGTAAVIVEVTTPYAAADLSNLDYAQTADTMYIVHPSYEPRKLTRSSHTSWSLATYSRTSDPFGAGPPLDWPGVVTFFEQRLIFGGSDANQQKIWGSVAGSYDDFTTGTDATDSFVYTIANGKVNRIVGMSGTEDFLAVFTVGAEFKASGGGNDDAITPTNISIKPTSYYGSSDIKPVRLDSHILYIQRDALTTRSHEFDAIQDGFTSINRNLTADQILQGRYGKTSGAKEMAYQAGFPSINWVVRNDGIMAALTFEPREQVNGWHRHVAGGNYTAGKLNKPEYESVASIPQVRAPDQVFIVVARTVDGGTVRYIEYFADQPNIPRFNDYFTGDKEADTDAYLQDLYEAQKRLCYLDSAVVFDGTISQTGTLSLATVGTGRTFTAGGSTFAATDVGKEIHGKMGGIAVITGYTSATAVTVEIEVEFPSTSIASGDWYLTNDTFAGAQHLEGETIRVLADGAVLEDVTVTNGRFTLDDQYTYVIAGLPYLGLFQSMDLEIPGDNGPGVTKSKGIGRLGAKFTDTLGCKMGTDLYNLEDIQFSSSSDITDRPPPLFSGVKEFAIKDSWNGEKYIYCVQDQPYPCNLQLYLAHATTNDG